ncbi:hypothetical protein BJ170DRAFT_114412 [Xylariales sp. AK1849]|nr:hypothetical protein BJ170DRAFT_114412 [Xylariales sp. AK1849]
MAGGRPGRPGRPRLRAASISTVDTIDEHSITYQKEDQVLRPAPPGSLSDDWPCFLLTNATVYNKHGAMANLLLVDLEGPFMVRGLLTIEPDQAACLVKGQMRSRSAWIEISRTYSYSIGLKEDAGMPVLWAAGESAHFEIVPSEQYEHIASRIFQGISLHYHVLDHYEDKLDEMKEQESFKSKAKRRRYRIQDVTLSIQDILFNYAVAVGDGATEEEVMRRFKDQADFLLVQFPKGTGFHNWLSSEFPDVVQRLGNKIAPSTAIPFAEPELPERKESIPSHKSSSAESRDTKGKSKAAPRNSASRGTRSSSKLSPEAVELSNVEQRHSRARSIKAKRKSPPGPGKHQAPEKMEVDSHDFAHEPVDATGQRIPPAGTTRGEPSATAPEATRSALFAVIDVLDELRANLLAAYNTGAKGKKHPDTIPWVGWLTKLYMAMSITNYSAKSEILQYHAGGLARHLGPEWHDSALYKWAKQNANVKPTFEHISEDHIFKVQRRQKNPNAAPRDDRTGTTVGQTPVETSGKQPPRGRPSGKAAGLRPSLGSKKRPRDQDGDDEMDVDDDDYPRRKTAKTSEYFTDGEIDGQVNATNSSDEDEDEDGQGRTQDPLTRVVIRAEPVPSTQPKGPNHTWTCEEPDCGYIVRSADDDEGQDLIGKHYEEHEKEASDEAKERELSKINLAMQESRGHLPIKYAYFPPLLIEVHHV